MTSLWTLVLIWNLGSSAGQNVVIPGFTSHATCMAASREVSAPMTHRWSAPNYVVCVEVR